MWVLDQWKVNKGKIEIRRSQSSTRELKNHDEVHDDDVC